MLVTLFGMVMEVRPLQPEKAPLPMLVTIWYANGGQTAAIIEGIPADAGHAIRDGDGGQAAAIRESTTVDTGHTIGDSDGSCPKPTF